MTLKINDLPDMWSELHPAVPRAFCAAFYKGTHPFPRNIYTGLAKRCDDSPYCHGELIFSNGWSASSTLMDDPSGVRTKPIYYSKGNDAWDFRLVNPRLEAYARQWFEEHDGQPYDVWGQARFLSGLFSYANNPNRWWCTESMAAALQRVNTGRWGPGGMAEEITSWCPPGEGWQGVPEGQFLPVRG